MPVANVTVDFVNQPKEGKRFGSIKTKELEYLSVKPADLALFSKGGKYQIEYTVNDKGYKDFVRVVAQANGAVNGAPNTDNNRNIFITGVVGRAMQSGKFGFDDLNLLTLKAAASWDQINPKKDEAPY